MTKETSAEELIQKTRRILMGLNKPGRRFRHDALIKESIEKTYYYNGYNKKLFNFSQDKVGMVSDAYIIYAIAMLGVADRKSIQRFLSVIKTRNPDLMIADAESDAGIKLRIASLKQCGFIYSMSYNYWSDLKSEESSQYLNSLYMVDSDGNEFVNQKFSVRIPFNKWMPAKQPEELMGLGCASYVGTCMMRHKNYVAYLDGTLRCKHIGVYFFPSEIKFQNSMGLYYVAIIDSFLFRNPEVQTEEAFIETKIRKINAIRNYLDIRTTKGETDCVICVESREDLKEITNLIIDTGTLLEHLQYIYFTGEGIMSASENVEDSFLRMYVDSEKKVQFYAAVPSFMSH